MSHICNSLVVTCIDFRFQKYIENWLQKNIGERQYDRVSWAGGVLNKTGILEQLALSKKLHKIKKSIFMNHEDCGGYGEIGTPEKHADELKNISNQTKQSHPDLDVEAYYIHLDGTFEKIV
jgi:carbonic anhydrase